MKVKTTWRKGQTEEKAYCGWTCLQQIVAGSCYWRRCPPANRSARVTEHHQQNRRDLTQQWSTPSLRAWYKKEKARDDNKLRKSGQTGGIDLADCAIWLVCHKDNIMSQIDSDRERDENFASFPWPSLNPAFRPATVVTRPVRRKDSIEIKHNRIIFFQCTPERDIFRILKLSVSATMMLPW